MYSSTDSLNGNAYFGLFFVRAQTSSVTYMQIIIYVAPITSASCCFHVSYFYCEKNGDTIRSSSMPLPAGIRTGTVARIIQLCYIIFLPGIKLPYFRQRGLNYEHLEFKNSICIQQFVAPLEYKG